MEWHWLSSTLAFASLPACLCAHLMFTSFFLYPNKSFQPEPSPLTQRRWTSSRTSGGTSGITSGSQMDPGRVKYESGVINWSLRMTSRNISPNLLLRAQNLKVNQRSFELDINASQACFLNPESFKTSWLDFGGEICISKNARFYVIYAYSSWTTSWQQWSKQEVSLFQFVRSTNSAIFTYYVYIRVIFL